MVTGMRKKKVESENSIGIVKKTKLWVKGKEPLKLLLRPE